MKKGRTYFTENHSTADAINPDSRVGRKAGNDIIDMIVGSESTLDDLAKMQEFYINKLVNYMIDNKSQDSNEIKRTLDSLLDIIDLGKGEEVFDRLLGYYRTIDRMGYEFYRKEAKKRRLKE